MSRTGLAAVTDLTASEISLIAAHSTAWQTASITSYQPATTEFLVPEVHTQTDVTWKIGVMDSTVYTEGLRILRQVVDLPGAYSWETRVWVYDWESGVLSEDVTTYDDGSTQTDYRDETGFRTHRISIDADTGEGLSYKTYTYQASGKMDTIFIRYADGHETTITYDETGKKSGKIHIDAADIFDWAVRSENYNSDGKHTSVLRIDDDGMQYLTTYNGKGEVTAKAYDDLGDRWSWTEKDWAYNDSGTITDFSILRDDGIRTTFAFEDGKKSIKVIEDTADAFLWSRDSTIYDAPTGTVEARQVVEDSGSWKEWRFDGGKTVSYFRSDVADEFLWDEVLVEYDDAGAVSYQRQVLDDGRILEVGVASEALLPDDDYSLLI